MTNAFFHRRCMKGACGKSVDFSPAAELPDFQWILQPDCSQPLSLKKGKFTNFSSNFGSSTITVFKTLT